jgi:hypothetical protein
MEIWNIIYSTWRSLSIYFLWRLKGIFSLAVGSVFGFGGGGSELLGGGDGCRDGERAMILFQFHREEENYV